MCDLVETGSVRPLLLCEVTD